MAEPIPPSKSPAVAPPGSDATAVPANNLEETQLKPESPQDSAFHVVTDAEAVTDLGWDEEPAAVEPLVPGMSNEDVWLLVRRMNKTVFHLKDSTRVPAGGLDLAVAPEQEFSPNKMRSQLERLYMSVIIRAMAGLKHVSRLRSWNEKTRTGAFCIAYFALWYYDFLTFGITTFILGLIVSPVFRRIAFPPAPLPLVGSLSGELTKPNSGMLGSKDSLTGAPENMKGESVENEASNFVTALAGIAMNIMSAKDPQGEPNPPELGLNGPMQADPNQLATMVASAKDKAEGADKPSQDKSKAPMETIMWSKVRPAMHVLTTISNVVEQLANALDPSPPFHPNEHRLRLASAILPMITVSPFFPRDLLFRAATFFIGVLIFGKPVLKLGSQKLDEVYPEWSSKVKITSFLLYGVPTNAQLSLALLRYGEKKKTPFPPPPRVHQEVPKAPLPLTSDILSATHNDQPLGGNDLELRQAAAPDYDMLDEAGGDDVEATKEEGSKEPHSFLKFIKGTTKRGVKVGVKIDKGRAKLGNEGAKHRTGVVPSKKHDSSTGPSEFDARYEGQKGLLYIDTVGSIPTLSFNKASEGKVNLWTIAISDIKELRKHSGYGFKTKLAAGWALDEELNDSLGITDKQGNELAVTAIPHRDALFNRLIAIGEQSWEVW